MSNEVDRAAQILAAHRIKYDSLDQNTDSWYCEGCRTYYRTQEQGERHVAEILAAVVLGTTRTQQVVRGRTPAQVLAGLAARASGVDLGVALKDYIDPDAPTARQ